MKKLLGHDPNQALV